MVLSPEMFATTISVFQEVPWAPVRRYAAGMSTSPAKRGRLRTERRTATGVFIGTSRGQCGSARLPAAYGSCLYVLCHPDREGGTWGAGGTKRVHGATRSARSLP